MKNFIVSKEGFPYIIFLALIAFLFSFYDLLLTSIFAFLALFIVFFFRNPRRKIVKNANHILSPADGVIMDIQEIDENTYINEKSVKVSIFLSIFNVHVNKSPIDGEVEYLNYRPGQYLPAFKSHCSEINEKNTIGIKSVKIKILVSQVTGFIARRIVCFVNIGDKVVQGTNFGLIKFGSCTEIIMPSSINLKVSKGQKVKGGITLIGEINNED